MSENQDNGGANRSENSACDQRQRIEQQIAAFENAWQSGQVPRLKDLVRAEPADEQAAPRELLIELVLVDMEYRWRGGAEGQAARDPLGAQPRWPDFLQHLPQLGVIQDVPPAALAEEYRIRTLWGDRPGHDHFLCQYPEHLTSLPPLLANIDAEIRVDRSDLPEPLERHVESVVQPDPRAPLPYSDYVLEEHAGTGGMGKVYRATQRSLGRKVAVKALLKSRQHDPDAVERFLQEARMLARLRHPNIVGVHGLGRFPGGGFFLVMDLIKGQDLQKRLETGALSFAEAARVTLRVAEAVQYAHSQNIVHCDLKPGNVLLDADGQVFVADFGLAQLVVRQREGKARRIVVGGTLGFMAPEQIDPAWGEVNATTDVYGIGGILYAAITGHAPVEGQNTRQVIERLCSGEAAPLPNVFRPGVPDQLSALCMRSLRKAQADRFQTAGQLAQALQEWLGHGRRSRRV